MFGNEIAEQVLLLAIGIWLVSSPKSVWWVSKVGRYKGGGPSEVELALIRIAGCILVLVAIISFF